MCWRDWCCCSTWTRPGRCCLPPAAPTACMTRATGQEGGKSGVKRRTVKWWWLYIIYKSGVARPSRSIGDGPAHPLLLLVLPEHVEQLVQRQHAQPQLCAMETPRGGQHTQRRHKLEGLCTIDLLLCVWSHLRALVVLALQRARLVQLELVGEGRLAEVGHGASKAGRTRGAGTGKQVLHVR